MVSSKEYEVLDVLVYDKYKNVHLKSNHDDTQHTVTVFPDCEEYDNLSKGNTVTGWIRRKGSYYNLVSYCKPERNWADNEEYL